MDTETMDKKREALKERHGVLSKRLRTLKVVRVEVDYDGCGDSGDVQEVRAIKASGDAANLRGQSVTVTQFESIYDEQTKGWRREPRQAVVALKDALGDFAVDFLSHLGIGWYNNEGGHGTVVLDVKCGKARAEHNYRIESSEYREVEL